MSCDWDGNRRSGVALAMRHRLKWFIHLGAQGLSKGEKHPTNTPPGYGRPTLYLYRSHPLHTHEIDKSPTCTNLTEFSRYVDNSITILRS